MRRTYWRAARSGSPYSLNHNVITHAQYSYLVATAIGSAVVPTMIASAFFMPRHLLPIESQPQQAVSGGPMTQEAH